MLLSVTSFFRAPEVFEALEAQVYPALFAHKDRAAATRVWVPACATGEEAYSLAISLLDFVEAKGGEVRLQSFATDVDEESIQQARRGLYPPNIAADVSAERLNRYFVRKSDSWQVTRRVRNLVVFSRQNALKDAPFSRLDSGRTASRCYASPK